ncbi:MAG: response regulator [Bdellovibrio sp.]
MKILVVDDESLVRRALVRAFEYRGYRVFQASDAEMGLEIWKEESPQVLVVDVLMPGKTGPEMILQGKKENLSYQMLVFISAFTGTENFSEQHLGRFLFLTKPFEDIFSVVARIEAEFSKPLGGSD